MTQTFTLAAAPDAATLKDGLAGVTRIDAAAVTRVTTPVPAAVSSTACGESATARRARSAAKGAKISGTIWRS